MAWSSSYLDEIEVASPCSADWNQMYGNERKRFCGDCGLNVYNLSGMTRDEAERLVTNSEGRLCITFFRRPDGTILTSDCPVGWGAVKRKTRIYFSAAASLMLALLTGVFFVSMFSNKRTSIGRLAIPFSTPPVQRTLGVMVNKKTPEPSPTPETNFDKGRLKVLTQIDGVKRAG